MGFKNRHKGETAIVVANGPSLTETPLDFLYSCPTFASNYVSLLPGFVPTYLTVIDPAAIGKLEEDNTITPEEERMSLIEPIVPMVENFFVIHTGKRLFKQYQNAQSVYNTSAASFSFSPIRYLFTGGTSTYTNLQLAFYMGFDSVAIVGLDHDYADGHFDKNYIQSVKIANAEVQKSTLFTMEKSYWMARRVYEQYERPLYNISTYSRCEAFLRGRPPWLKTGEFDPEDWIWKGLMGRDDEI